MVSPFEIMGIIAACLTSTGLFPQAFKGLTTKRTQDVSWTMPLVMSLGTVLWIIYAHWRNDVILFWSSAVGLSGASMLLGVKVFYNRKRMMRRHKLGRRLSLQMRKVRKQAEKFVDDTKSLMPAIKHREKSKWPTGRLGDYRRGIRIAYETRLLKRSATNQETEPRRSVHQTKSPTDSLMAYRKAAARKTELRATLVARVTGSA